MLYVCGTNINFARNNKIYFSLFDGSSLEPSKGADEKVVVCMFNAAGL